MGVLGGALGGVGAAAAQSVGQAVGQAVGQPVGQPVGGVAAGTASQLAGFGAGAVLGAISDWVVSAAQWILSQVGGALSSSTRPGLSAHWFASHYEVMAGAAAFVVVPLLLVCTMQAVLRQDPSPLVRSALVQLPLALLLAAVAVQLVQLGLAAVDALSRTVAASAGNDIAKLLGDVAAGLQAPATAGGAPAFVVFVAALVLVLASFALWIELIVRTAAIYVAVLFLPLALAGLVWHSSAHWARRLAETLAALVLSKLVVVGVLSLGAAALAGGRAGFGQVLEGAALLLLAAFSPFVLLRLLPVVEAGAVSQLEGASRRTAKALHLPSLDTLDSLLLSATAGPVGVTEAEGSGIGMALGTPYRPWDGGGDEPDDDGEDRGGAPGPDLPGGGPGGGAGAPGGPDDAGEQEPSRQALPRRPLAPAAAGGGGWEAASAGQGGAYGIPPGAAAGPGAALSGPGGAEPETLRIPDPGWPDA
jgi:type IV secretion system protein TrbL